MKKTRQSIGKKGHEMLIRTTQLCGDAHLVSPRAGAARVAMWHRGTNFAIPTVGTGFKPYHQRPKEKLQ